MNTVQLSPEELGESYHQTMEEFLCWKKKGLSLNIARGKPSKEQLELSRGSFSILDFDQCIEDGIDARNYGEIQGMPSARRYWAELLEVDPSQCFVGGSSSLTMMYDLIAKAWSHGLLHSEKPWGQLEAVKFLCPAPGYNRHFRITQAFGMKLVPIPMTDEGPDMNAVRQWASDPTVKGIWCVPKYSNPDGIIYSNQVIEEIASLRPAAPDFVVMWDNAYLILALQGDAQPIPEILHLCAQKGNPDLVVEFASTSKITLPGAGMAVMAASENNIHYFTQLMEPQMISYDKVNQLRQVHFLQDRDHTLSLMRQHGEILRPKFEAFLEEFEQQLAPHDLASWTRPKGGYFIGLYTKPGCAKRTVELCREIGLILTDAGATYPYGHDPNDRHIRIAPSYPPLEEVRLAAKAFCTCLKLATLEQQYRRTALDAI